MTTSALADQVDITLHAGNDVTVTVTVTDSNDDDVWLHNWTSELLVSRNLSVKLTLTSADGDIEHYPDTDDLNELIVTFAADGTRELSGDYDYELKGTTAAGEEATLMYGTLTFVATADRT